MMPHQWIAQECIDLPPHETVRLVCPFCDGGASKEKSLAVSRSPAGLLLYICFRGNCGAKGVIGDAQPYTYKVGGVPRKKFTPYRPNHLVDVDRPHNPEGVHHQLADWGLDPQDCAVIGWKYDIRQDRIAIPVYSPRGKLRGYVLRAYRQGRTPKVLTARMVDERPFQGWVWPDEPPVVGKSIVVVEDLPSATRCAQQGRLALALLGNTPCHEALEELHDVAKAEGMDVVFALDPDASSQAINLVRQYGLRGRASVCILHKDYKNMNDEELAECLMSVP